MRRTNGNVWSIFSPGNDVITFRAIFFQRFLEQIKTRMRTRGKISTDERTTLAAHARRGYRLSCRSLFEYNNIIEIALNKILRKVWNLPYNSHTAIVHCVAHASTVSNLVYKRFSSLICRALSFSPLVYNVFLQSLQCASSFCGYNNLYGHHHLRVFSEDDNATASLIRILRLHHGLNSPVEDVIRTLSCD